MKPDDLQLGMLEQLPPGGSSLRVGRLIGTNLRGEPVVDFAGSEAGPLVARVLSSAVPPHAAGEAGATVVLAFEDEDPQKPVILGFAVRRLPVVSPAAHRAVDETPRTLELNASERISIECGRASITLFADGRIVVKGTRLLSRASESNKIKGATVAVN